MKYCPLIWGHEIRLNTHKKVTSLCSSTCSVTWKALSLIWRRLSVWTAWSVTQWHVMSSPLQTITTWNAVMHRNFVQPLLSSQCLHNTPTFLFYLGLSQGGLLSLNSRRIKLRFLSFSKTFDLQQTFAPLPFTCGLILLHIWTICMWMCVKD